MENFGGFRMKKTFQKSWVYTALLVMLLPFIHYAVNITNVLAETTGQTNNQPIKLFDTVQGTGTLEYKVEENDLQWTLKMDQKVTATENQFQLSLKQKDQPLEVKNIQVAPSGIDYESDQTTKQLIEKNPSANARQNTITFETAKVDQVTITPSIIEKDGVNATDLLKDQKPIELTIATDSSSTSSSTSTTSAPATTSSLTDTTTLPTTDSSETTTTSTANKVELGDKDDATFESAKKEAEKRYKETGQAQEITRSAGTNSLIPSSLDTEPGNLVISDKATNDINTMSITISGDKGVKTSIIRDPNTDSGLAKVYSVPGEIVIKLGESTTKSFQDMSNVSIDVVYPSVGFFTQDDGITYPVEAHMHISNLKRSYPKNGQTISEYHNPFNKSETVGAYNYNPAEIRLSGNMFSGGWMRGFNGADYTFQYVTNPTEQQISAGKQRQLINFSNSPNALMSFSSLNSYELGSEFVATDNPVYVNEKNEKAIGENITQIKQPITTESKYNLKENGNNYSGKSYTFQNAYYADGSPEHNIWNGKVRGDGGADGDDILGANNFPKNSVAFRLKGTSNTFTIGTGGGAGDSQWFTLASSATVPIKQPQPTKTVQPIDQYTNKKIGSTPSGFDQRYWDDLDSYDQSGTSDWDLPKDSRVASHDAGKAGMTKDLDPNILEKQNRFVAQGQDFYYFINQKTINLASQGIVIPTGYVIKDTFPKGVQLSKEDVSSFTLYDQQGTEIKTPFDSDSLKFNVSNHTFEAQLSDKAVQKINDLSKNEKYYGKDFSLRVKAHVNKVTENIDPQGIDTEFMDNQAETEFLYPDSNSRGGEELPPVAFDAKTNWVRTKVRTVSLVKQDGFHHTPLANASYDLYKGPMNTIVDENGNLKTKIAKLTSATSNSNGILDFLIGIAPGTYTIVETNAPDGYEKQNREFTVDENYQVSGLDGLDATTQKTIVNDKPKYTININKIDSETKKALSGAIFTIVGSDGKQIGAELPSDDKGSVKFSSLDFNNTYTISEKTAPNNYLKLTKPIIVKPAVDSNGKPAFTVTIEGNEQTITPDGNGAINITFDVPNKAKVPLPSTGGSGTLIYTVAGLVGLTITGGYFIYRRNRKEVA